MKYIFLLLILLVLIWLKIAILPAGTEAVLVALLASTFAFSRYETFFAALGAGLLLDYFSILPFGVLTLSMIASVIIFLLYGKLFSLNIKSFFVSLFFMLLLYYFFLLGLGDLFNLLFPEAGVAGMNFRSLLYGLSPMSWVYNGILILAAAYFINSKYIHDEFFKI